MATAKQFEELIIWQESRILIKELYLLFEKNKDFSFRDQIQRAAVSIMNNIAEGFERDSKPDFIKFLFYSKSSCGEVRSMLYLALDLKYISQIEFDEMNKKTLKLSVGIYKLIKYLTTLTKK